MEMCSVISTDTPVAASLVPIFLDLFALLGFNHRVREDRGIKQLDPRN
jgi:hypothetical protein